MAGLSLRPRMVADGDPYHQPRRLSVVSHAPVDRVRECLADGGWLVELPTAAGSR